MAKLKRGDIGDYDEYASYVVNKHTNRTFIEMSGHSESFVKLCKSYYSSAHIQSKDQKMIETLRIYVED